MRLPTIAAVSVQIRLIAALLGVYQLLALSRLARRYLF